MPAGRPSAPRRRARRAAIVLLLVLPALLLGLIGLGLFPQEGLRRLVERRLGSALGAEVRLGGLRVIPIALRAEIADLSIAGGRYRLEVPRARLALSLETLFAGRLALRSLEVDRPRLVVRAPTAGARTAPSPRLALTRPVSVGRVAVTGATLVYSDPALGGDVSLHGIDVRGGVGDGAVEVVVAGGAWERPAPIPLGPARARLRVTPSLEVHVEALEGGTAGSRLALAGALGPVTAPRPDLRIEARIDLGEVARLAGGPKAAGTLTAEARVRGIGAGLEGDGRLEGRRLVVAGWPVDRLSARATLKPDGITASLTAELLGGRAEGTTRAAGTRSDGRLRLSGVDLERARLHAAPFGPRLPGTVDGDLTWTGDLAGVLETRGHLELHSSGDGALGPGAGALRLRAEARGPFRLTDRTVDLAWDATIDGESPVADAAVIGLRRLHLAGRGTARGPLPPTVEGRIDGAATLRAGLRSATLDLTGSLRVAAGLAASAIELRGLGGSVSAAGQTRGDRIERLSVQGDSLDLEHFEGLIPGLRGRAAFALEASGRLDRPSGSLRGRIDGLAALGVALGVVDAELKASDGVAEILVELPDLNLTGRGRARGKELDAAVVLAGTSLAPFAPWMPAGLPLSGEVSGSAEIAASLERLAAARAVARIDRLEAASGRLAASAAPFTVTARGTHVEVQGLRLAGEGLAFEASGSFGIGADASVDLRGALRLDLSRLSAPAGWTVSGTIESELALAGTPRRPQARGHATALSVEAAHPRLPPVSVTEARVELAGDALSLAGATAEVAGGRVTLSGRLPYPALLSGARARPARLQPAEEMRLHLTWEGIEATRLLERLLPGRPVPLAASLSGEVRLAGGLGSTEEVRAEVALAETAMDVEEVPLRISPVAARLEEGRVLFEPITVSTEEGSLRIEGRADARRGTLDLSGRGALELRALSPFLEEASLAGRADVDLSLRGTLDAPRPVGTVRVRDATLRIRTIPQALTALNATLVFEGAGVRVQEASAALGGGTLTIAGSAALTGLLPSDVQLDITGRDMALRYPEGFRSRVNADLRLTGRWADLRLSGQVRAQRGIYDLDIALEETLFAPMAWPFRSPLLRAIALEARVETEGAVLVRNNVADLEATGSLTIRGDMENPAPFGRLEIDTPGGKVFLHGRDFHVTKGTLLYGGSWTPSVSLEAERVLRDAREQSEHTVTVAAEGSLDRIRLSLRSRPTLSEAEIVNLIATGRADGTGTTDDTALRSGARVVGGQFAVLVAGRLTRNVSRGLRGLGLGDVSIQPELIARETDPGARFTFGKALTRHLGFVYSLGLGGPEERFFRVEVRPGRQFVLSVQRADDGRSTLGAGQRLSWGGPPESRAEAVEEKVRLREVRLEGDRPLREEDLRAALRARPERRVSFWDLQEDADRLRERLRDAGHLEAEVGARLDDGVAVFRVRSGPRYRWRVVGMDRPPGLSGPIRRALFEEEAVESARRRLLRELRGRGHLRAAVRTQLLSEGGEKILVFTAQPGPVIAVSEVRVPGASALSERRLLASAGGPAGILSSPDEATKGIRDAYRQAHYLTAEAGPPRLSFSEDGASVAITVPVREGPRARVREVRFEGVTLPTEPLARAAGVETGTAFDPALVTAAVGRLREHYFGLGFPAVRVAPALLPSGSDLDLVFRVAEGQRVVVGDVVVSGTSRTRESLVRRLVPFKAGEPLDPRKLATLERRLLDLGAFSRAVVTTTPENPTTLHVEVKEAAPLSAGYDLRYTEDEGASGLVEGELRNILGLGLALGGRYRVGADLREARGSLHLPSLGRAGKLTATVFRLDEELPALAGAKNDRVQQGLQIQHSLDLTDRWTLLYGYSFKRAATTSPILVVGPITENVAGVDVSVFRDTRDDLLDPRRGRFLSLNLELSPSFLGADFTFVKGFAQAFVTRPLGPSLTWAQGYRLGLAHGLRGQRLVSSERFQAGGANSVRGFGSGELGPQAADGAFLGGQAVVILNQELRYQHPSGLGAAVFYDAGNVFATVGEMSLDLRHAVGAGLRYASPVGLLRVDVALPFARREGEKTYKVHLSLGQAF